MEASFTGIFERNGISFYSLLGIKWHMHADGRKCSSERSTKTTKCSSWPSKVFVIVFKIISVTGRPTSSCFRYISLAGCFAVSYFVTLLPFNIISVVDRLAPSCYLVELFSRLIATLRVVLFAPLRYSKKTSMGENCFCRGTVFKLVLSLIARLWVVLVPGFKTF